MEKEKVLEIESQEVFDRVAVRIKYLDDEFFAGGLLKEDVKKYKCDFIESPTDLEERIILLNNDIFLSDSNIYCYKQEKIKEIKEFIDFINEKYGIPKRWRAERGEKHFSILSTGGVGSFSEYYDKFDNDRYDLGNYFKTKEQAQKVVDSKEWQEFWAKVRAGEIGGDE